MVATDTTTVQDTEVSFGPGPSVPPCSAGELPPNTGSKNTLFDRTAGRSPTIKPEQPPRTVLGLRAFTDVSMKLEINGCICTGRVDYALGFSPPGQARALETFFVVVGTKKGATRLMDDAMAQALFYLGEKEKNSLFP